MKETLESNWLHKDDGDCMAVYRLYDPQSDWECLVYAQNPDDQEEIAVLVTHPTPELCVDRWRDLDAAMNIFPGLRWDDNFVPVRVNTYLRRLKNVFEGSI